MNLRSPILRVAFGISMLTLTLLLIGDSILGVSAEGVRPQLVARKYLAETLAVQYSELASRDDFKAMEGAMRLLVKRNPEVLSTALRRSSGAVLAEAGDHRRHWVGAPVTDSSPTHARVPVFDGSRPWGTLEVRFTEIGHGSLLGLVGSPWFKMLVFVALAGFAAYLLYMRRTLRHLDPSAVIPARVKAAFDVLAEGVAFVDAEERIVLVNFAFAALIGRSPEQLMGVRLGSLGWIHGARHDVSGTGPAWTTCLERGSALTGAAVVLENGDAGRREFMVNAAPVLDDRKRARGAIVTFDDVTELESKRQDLERVVAELSESRDQVQRQNERLEIMATRDPMTNCLNRRSFMKLLDSEVERARRDGADLACVMLDIDHFKRVNDELGHLTGDAAIRFVAGLICEVARGYDIVCRFGGEEFCVLLPAADADTALQVSEDIRKAVMAKSPEGVPELQGRSLTVSLGVAVLSARHGEGMALVDEADSALYSSKSSGRNRTTVAGDVAPLSVSVA